VSASLRTREPQPPAHGPDSQELPLITAQQLTEENEQRNPCSTNWHFWQAKSGAEGARKEANEAARIAAPSLTFMSLLSISGRDCRQVSIIKNFLSE
jgi:hypothetical protein